MEEIEWNEYVRTEGDYSSSYYSVEDLYQAFVERYEKEKAEERKNKETANE